MQLALSTPGQTNRLALEISGARKDINPVKIEQRNQLKYKIPQVSQLHSTSVI